MAKHIGEFFQQALAIGVSVVHK